MIIIPKTRTLSRGRPNSVLRRRRQFFGDYDTITMEEAAAILGKSTKTLQRWRAIGYGPLFKLDRRYVSCLQISDEDSAKVLATRLPVRIARSAGAPFCV
jgi:hypothetical protein